MLARGDGKMAGLSFAAVLNSRQSDKPGELRHRLFSISVLQGLVISLPMFVALTKVPPPRTIPTIARAIEITQRGACGFWVLSFSQRKHTRFPN